VSSGQLSHIVARALGSHAFYRDVCIQIIERPHSKECSFVISFVYTNSSFPNSVMFFLQCTFQSTKEKKNEEKNIYIKMARKKEKWSESMKNERKL
jgi:hypothetical protein